MAAPPHAPPPSGAAALACLIAGATLVRLAMAWLLGLGIDESYMVAAGRDLRLGYFDHPPLSWWLSSGIAHLTGSEAPVVVRLPFIALGALSTWMLARLTALLVAPQAAIWAALAFTLAPVLGFTTSSWVLPDGPLVAALLAAALCLAHALRGVGWRWWLGAGVCAGLALLAKYSAVLTLGGAFVYLLTQREHRRWLARPQPYVAVLVALAVFAPVVAWNATHGWASFAFQGGRAGGHVLLPLGPLSAVAGQAGFLLPWIWLGLIVAGWRALRRGPGDSGSWLLLCLAAPPILLFTLVALWTRPVLFHWAAPGYLFLFPLLGGVLAPWPARRVWAWATALVIALSLGFVTVQARLGWPPLPRDPIAQALDWTKLRGALAERGLLDHTVAAPSWADTGKVDYALGGRPRVLCLNVDCRQYLFAPGPAAHLGTDILIVAPRQDEARIRADYGGVFAEIEALPPARFALPGGRQVAMGLYLGRNLKAWPP